MTRSRRLMAGAGAFVVVAVIGAVIVVSGRPGSLPAAAGPSATTAKVVEGSLSSTVSLNGTVTYRARPDGSPYVAVNQARGTYTALPEAGAEVACGAELYRVDDRPVLLLCGPVPAYRDLHREDVGADVRQLNANLHTLGYDVSAGVAIDPGDRTFTERTEQALEALQQHSGIEVSGVLVLSQAIVLPEAVRIATVTGGLGTAAQPGTPVVDATSDTPEVQVDLEASQQREVEQGDRAQITLPDNTTVMGTVDRFGRVAQVPAGTSGQNGQSESSGSVVIPASISLDDPAATRGLDQASVRVEVTTHGVDDVLSVPVTAILGRSGGGFAVEVVRAGGARELVAVKLGLFDTGGGRVQVDGELHAGDDVVVPTS